MATASSGFDPYYKWLGIRPEERPIHSYRLLGVALFESDADVIANAADRQMAHVRSFQGGRYVSESQRILNEIAAARVCLLNPGKKAAYDEALRRELAAVTAARQAAASSAPFATGAKPLPSGRLQPVRQPQGKWRHDRRVQVALGAGTVVLLLLTLLFVGSRGSKTPGPKAMPEPASVAAKPEQPDPAVQPEPPRDDAAQGPPPFAIAPFSAEEAKKHQERWAAYLKVPPTLTNSIGMKLILIPPGEFDMGSSREEVDGYRREQKERGIEEKKVRVYIAAMLRAEGPRHRVKITRPFYLGICEVTQSQWIAVQGKNRSYFAKATLGEASGERPIEMLPWNEAAEFCKKLSAQPQEVAAKRVYRLPTEAEWEYACRAGSDTSHFFGNEAKLGDYAWFETNSNQRPHPVGLKKANAWGLYDVYGNVWEWCADSWSRDYYEQSSPRDPQGPPPNEFHIRRGGSWRLPELLCRSAFRFNHSGISYDTGFRAVCEVPAGGTSSGSRSLAR